MREIHIFYRMIYDEINCSMSDTFEDGFWFEKILSWIHICNNIEYSLQPFSLISQMMCWFLLSLMSLRISLEITIDKCWILWKIIRKLQNSLFIWKDCTEMYSIWVDKKRDVFEFGCRKQQPSTLTRDHKISSFFSLFY